MHIKIRMKRQSANSKEIDVSGSGDLVIDGSGYLSGSDVTLSHVQDRITINFAGGSGSSSMISQVGSGSTMINSNGVSISLQGSEWTVKSGGKIMKFNKDFSKISVNCKPVFGMRNDDE